MRLRESATAIYVHEMYFEHQSATVNKSREHVLIISHCFNNDLSFILVFIGMSAIAISPINILVYQYKVV